MTVRTAREMRQRLTRFHHCSEPIDDPRVRTTPQWLVVFEVPITTTRYRGIDLGQPTIGTKQRIDVVAVGLWDKRTANEIRGYEIKVSRSDLLTELRDPGKAAAGVAQCDSWWLALADPKLLKDSDNLPDGWGVLACSGSGMKVIHPAAQQHGEHSGQFIAGLMQAQLRSSTWRRASGYSAGFTRGVTEGKRVGRVHYLPREMFTEGTG